MKYTKYISLILFMITTLQIVSAIDVTNCGTLDIDGGNYNLQNNVSSAGTCFEIGANNLILDGQGLWINYSQSVTGYAINNSDGYDNITIKNLNIIQGNSSLSYAYAIYSSGMINSTIINNTIKTYSSSNSYVRNHPIFLNLLSNFNNITNNTITTYGSATSSYVYLHGIKIVSSDNNTIQDNTIQTDSASAHGIYIGSSNTNIFSNNTITTSGKDAANIWIYLSNTNTFKNNNITSLGRFGHGIVVESSTNLNNLSNNTITTSGIGGFGIYLYSSSDNILSNNNIITSGSDGYGIATRYSNSNNILNNTILTLSGTNAWGIFIRNSNSNNISGGSIISQSSGSYAIQAADTTNYFSDTNFTTQRIIYFYDPDSWFNYNNETDGNIWLKNNITVYYREINRVILTWSQSKMEWNDFGTPWNPTERLTAYYNLTGLLPNAYYRIYNNSNNSYNLFTDESGNLPTFSIVLNAGDYTQIKIVVGIIVYAYNSTANDYTNDSTYSVQPNQGILIYSPVNFTWVRTTI